MEVEGGGMRVGEFDRWRGVEGDAWTFIAIIVGVRVFIYPSVIWSITFLPHPWYGKRLVVFT